MRIPALVSMIEAIEAPTLARRDILCIGTMMKRVLSAVFTITLACSLAACAGGSSSVSASNPPEQGNDTDTSQARLADSMQSYFQQQLDNATEAGDAVSPQQIDILQRGVDAGTIPMSDYEQSWSDYKQCMISKGQPEPILTRYENGIYVQALVKGSDKAMNEFFSAQTECETRHVTFVNQAYRVQLGNTELYADANVAIVDCMKKAGAVPMSYTIDQLLEERGAGTGAFDRNTIKPEVRSCNAANGRIILDTARDEHQILDE